MAKSAAPKLKVFAIVWWGYSYAFRHIPLMFRAGAPVILVLLLSFWAIFIAAVLPEYSPVFDGWWLFAQWLLIPLIAHFAVAWHRSILLGEMRPRVFRFGKPEVFYLLVSLLFFLPDKAFLWVAGMLQGSPIASTLILMPYFLIGVAIILATPILPALAIEDRAMKVTIIWRQLRGNWIRFISIGLICYLVGATVSWSTIKTSTWIELTLLAALSVDPEMVGKFQIDFLKVALIGVLPSTLLALETLVFGAAMIGTLSIIYAGIVRRTLESKVDYVAVDRLADRLTA